MSDADRAHHESLTTYERLRMIQVLQAEVANNFDDHVKSIGDLANLTPEKLIPIVKGTC